MLSSMAEPGAGNATAQRHLFHPRLPHPTHHSAGSWAGKQRIVSLSRAHIEWKRAEDDRSTKRRQEPADTAVDRQGMR